jgi:hypothetical protein
MDCKTFQNELPDLLLDPTAPASLAAVAHLRECPPCELEYNEYQATFGLLDSWHAPEPTPYFDQKLSVLIREEQAAPRMGWFERLQSRFLFNSGRQLRPMLAGGLSLLLLVGGGSVAELVHVLQPHPVVMSATVDDLQILDRNEQAFQQMDQLLDDDGGSSSDQQAPNNQPIS